ncbi:MAG: hypothetical protein KKC84_02410, partial [Candidatus Omnitrophica bacterium]|nr:hypothetical protein [Candidatus Omnitrophota bacterium]
QKITTNKAFQVTGLTNSTPYYFVVRNASGTTHSGGDDESTNTNQVSTTPTANASDIPPTFSGIERAYCNSYSGCVDIEYSAASDPNTPITYKIFASTNLATLFTSPEYSPTTPSSSYQLCGLTDGTLYYFAVRARDYQNNEEKNTRYETAIPYGNVDHITISSATSGTVGTPVLVKLTAYSSADDSTPDTTFSDAVKVQIGEISPSYFLSVKDRVTENVAEVPMSNGVGYFTIDSPIPQIINFIISGISYIPSGLGQQIVFSPASTDSSVTQFALVYDTKVKAGNNPEDGSCIRIYAVDSTGKTKTDYTGTITWVINDPGNSSISKEVIKGDGVLNPNDYTFVETDKGEMVLHLKDTEQEDVTFTINSPFSSNPSLITITYYGVSKYLLEAAGQTAIDASTTGTRIKYIAYAAASDDTKLGGYSETAQFIRQSETNNNDSSTVSPSSIEFLNGKAEFYVENSEYETVAFKLQEIANPSIESASTNANFASSDTTAPDIREVVAETPFLIHIYFTEEVDTTNAQISTNYTGVGTINKICWYGNEVTLHLASALTLGSTTESVSVNGVSPNGIKDDNGNFMGNKNKGFTVPHVNYQSSSYGSSDWLEIQVSPSTVAIGAQTVKVIVYHKNACGYLSGSNSINKATDVSSVGLSYTNSQYLSSPPSSTSMSDGKSEVTLNTAFTSPSQTFTVTASAGGVTSGKATITSQ